MMNYVSTRGGGAPTIFRDALLRGMAPDGGLYMPESWPTLSAGDIRAAAAVPYADLAAGILGKFAGNSLPAAAVRAAADRLTETFHHAAITPLVQLEPNLWVLELFHGPTAAFKDLAMQMMAVLTDAALEGTGQRLLLLTATSGDTGAAAVRAFAGAKSVDLAVLHPLDRVSPVQRRQMTTVDAPNVLNLAVRGDFDDCQRLVKAILADETLREGRRVSSVNSINWGRLAGQVPYYVAAASALGAPHVTPRFVVPTGNFGDAFAAWVARAMGVPLTLTAAVNRNDALARALNHGRYERTAANPPPASAWTCRRPPTSSGCCSRRRAATPTPRALSSTLSPATARWIWRPTFWPPCAPRSSAVSIDEDRTRAEIAHAWKAYGRVICPHTAVALAAARDMAREGGPVVALSTAHPAKFPESVAPVLGFEPPVPPALAAITGGKERLTVIDADLDQALGAVKTLRSALHKIASGNGPLTSRPSVCAHDPLLS